MVIISKATARPSYNGNRYSLECFGNIASDTAIIFDIHIFAYPDSIVCTASKILYKMTIEITVDLV
jgi:hypothetical protein